MKWISDLLRRSDDKAAAPQAVAIPVPTVDVERLRNELKLAANEAERLRIAGELGQALAGLAQTPQTEDPPEVWATAACSATDKSLALDCASRLRGDTWLTEVAIYARLAEVRLAAVCRLDDSPALERVAQLSRDKDKRIYRHCADLLRQRRQAGEHARRAADMTVELRGLLEHAPMPLSRLLALKKEFDTLGDGDGSLAECRQLMDEALARLQQEAETRRALQARQTTASSLLAECSQATWPWGERLDDWRSRLASLTQAGLPAWLATEAPARTLTETLHAIERSLAALAADAERALACEQFLAALAADSPPDAAAWEALAKPDNADARLSLETRFHTLQGVPAAAAAISPPIEKKAEPRPQIDHGAVRDQLEGLEQAIEQGHLVAADTAAKAIKTSLDGGSLHGAMESRLQRALAQLDKLHGWARWGAGQAREHLVAAAEDLLKGEHSVDDLAVAIPALRAEWKRLNAHAPAANELWKQFDNALEQAYQPVAARRAEEAARQAEARTAREAMCAEWEAWANGIDWGQADYKLIEARREEMVKRWRVAPHAGFRDERLLRKRFDTLLVDLDGRLDAARSAELLRRQQLIAEAEMLVEAKEIGQAMTQAKALQERWRQTSVRLKRGDEQKLWERFRAACNAVFARRDVQRAEQAVQRQERAQMRKTLLDAFEATLVDADAYQTKQALTKFRADWDACKAGPREAADSLDKRAGDLQQQAQRRIDDLRQEKHRSRFDLLVRKAALADRVESAVLAAEPIDEIVATTRQTWDGLPQLPGKTEGLLAARLEAATAITAESLAAGRISREALLLDLEIALDLPSPKNCVEIRRQRQLDRLKNRFGTGSAPLPEAETMLVQWYATAAAPDRTLAKRMEAVVQKLSEKGAGR